ncbi:uncharacterized protein LOC121733945 [Aricia agestis]|uniref:uncharacterized protein LOC121733945 n=1 Tax=Aricia agestis TaxID=91739 RepID=UPI001C2047DF|nr:uncharacterized protein LOC121733945 [Aricia agestis]
MNIFNCQISDTSWAQATLPIRFGGLGLRSVSSVSLPAFLSSAHSIHPLFIQIITNSFGNIGIVSLTEAINAWKRVCPSDVPVNPNIQKNWDEPLIKLAQSEILSSSSTTDRARLLASAEPESGYWLQAYPSSNTGTLLDNHTFNLSLSLRLGANISEPHRCHCGAAVDRQGHHGLSCRRSAGRQSRHASLNDVIRRALASVNVPATLEPNGIARDDGKRPDGMTLVPWSRGRPLVWDATCVDTLAASHVTATTREAGAAAAQAETNKRRKYEALGNDYFFVPFGVETLGPWGPGAQQMFRELSQRLVEKTNDPRAGAYLGQRISLAIQRGKAASLLGTLPAASDLDLVFYI